MDYTVPFNGDNETMFETIIKSNSILQSVSNTIKQLDNCSGDEAMYLIEVFKKQLESTDKKNPSNQAILVYHLLQALTEISKKKKAAMKDVLPKLEYVRKGLVRITDTKLYNQLNIISPTRWKYQIKTGLHTLKDKDGIVYHAQRVYSPNPVFFIERR